MLERNPRLRRTASAWPTNGRIAVGTAFTVFVWLWIVPGKASAEDSADVFFRNKVEPILVRRCLQCHAADRKGGLDLRTRTSMLKGGDSGAVVSVKKPADSLLLQYVTDGDMPPDDPLSANEVAVLKQWIGDGAFFPNRTLDVFSLTTKKRAGYDWWSLQPVRKPKPTSIKEPGRAKTPIDRFIVSRLEKAGLSLAAPADRATYIRRVSHDLTGLGPTYEEVREFVSDRRPDADERLVDRLLASPHYGERWGRHWLDVVRFAESNGFERDRIRTNFWRYRDYVIDALNQDKPYDDFVSEQLAGDALDGENRKFQIATGFLVAGPKNDVSTISELERMQTRQDELDEYVSVTVTTFLGLTAGCARCHDHKFDPITTHDYYSLTAVFSGLDRGDVVVATPADKAIHAAAVGNAKKAVDSARAEIDELLDAVRKRVLVERVKNSKEMRLPAVTFKRNEDLFESTPAKFVRFTISATTKNSQPCLDELEIYGANPKKNLALASIGSRATASSLLPGYKIHQIHHLNDGKHGNAHSWISNEPGKGWAQIELASVGKINRVVWGRDLPGQYRDRLPIRYRITVSLDGKSWQQVSSSDGRIPFSGTDGKNISKAQVVAAFSAEERAQYDRLQARETDAARALASIAPLSVSYSAKDGPPVPSFVLNRGNVRDRRSEVNPAALRAVTSLPRNLHDEKNNSGPRRRLRLAQWITDTRNPLTSRVFVNRVWQYHFGKGIVNTPNDFGFNGGRPSHPELLDWLAADFMEHGWRIKRLHRMICLSAVYRQSATFNEAAAEKDASNRLLWRMSPKRLDAESLRDAILQVSGKLDGSLGGPSFRLFDYRDGNVPDYLLIDNPGPETWRRAVYRFNIRTFQSPLMEAFDCPDPSVQTPKRSQSTTALQALSLMNNRFVFEQSRHFAQRVAVPAGDDSKSQVRLAYRLALRRDPTDEQLQSSIIFIQRHGLFSLCRVLLNTNEFLYVF